MTIFFTLPRFFRQIFTHIRKAATPIRKVCEIDIKEISEFRTRISVLQTQKLTMTALANPINAFIAPKCSMLAYDQYEY